MKLLSLLLIGTLLSFSPNSNAILEDNTAPEISLSSPDGEVINLSSLRGNIVLVDFWASWCSPCRKRHPELVGVYDNFKDKAFKNAEKFEIYSVSLDNNKDRWIGAIEKDNLSWVNHVSDLKGWRSSAAVAYGIRSIPSNVLLNEKGEIIGKNLFGKELEAVLAEL